MSADVLRRAASLMRKRAEAATTGQPSETGDESWWGVEGMSKVITNYADARGFFIDKITEDAEHIASWHPVVALAVADLLERLVKRADEIAEASPFKPGSVSEQHVISGFIEGWAEALAVARAFLGESA